MANFGEILNSTRNTINSICSDIGLNRAFRKLTNALYGSGGFMARPIGIVAKNYDFIKNTLNSNIGNGLFNYDGYGTPISSLADPELTSKSIPWFISDSHKNKYDNYLNYINDMYYDGYMSFPNFITQEEKVKFFNYRDLLLENNTVGVIRNYDVTDTLLASRLLPNGVQSNPNSPLDSRTGVINNFYLNATLQNSYSYYLDNITNFNRITDGAYDLFGFLGNRGMVNGEYTLTNDSVLPQDALTYLLFGFTPLNSGYGFYDSTMPSSELIDKSSYKTKQFILKSLLGYDLSSNTEVVFDDYDVTDYSLITGKKYFPKKGQDYLSKMSDVWFDTEPNNEELIRYGFNDSGNGHSTTSRTLYVYAETEGSLTGSPFTGNINESWNEGVEYGSYSPYDKIFDIYGEKNDIISYTNKCFQLGKFDTLIGRFHTDEYESAEVARISRDMLSSSISKYGMSHGRNLLKKDHESTKMDDGNGYSDPYCRVWTFHKQYSKLENLIRPLYGNSDNLDKTIISEYQPYRSRLEKYGVKDKSSRLVKIAPTIEDPSIKNCMFSIENLAWKYERNGFIGHSEQKGPLGGRIMWFPPYGLSFSESVNVSWNPTQFIGRDENIYTYTNSERSGTLSFKLLIDHPSLLNSWRTETGGTGSVDDVNSVEQKILRFFAGCEVLEEVPKKVTKKVIEVKPIIPPQPKPQPILVPHKESASVYFYVFFPNDYSGVDDSENGQVKPIEYLVNGIGCQKSINGNDIGTSLTVNYGHVGYEMWGSQSDYNGISCGLNLTTSASTVNGTQIGVYTHTGKDGKKHKWGYRVDSKYANEVFRNSNSYFDLRDCGLNGTGYTQLLNYHTDAQSIDGGLLFSFADVVCALEPTAKTVLEGAYDSNNVDVLIKLFEEYDVLSVEANGYASSHGYTSNNNELNENRAKTVLNWLYKCNSSKFTKEKCKVTKTGIGTKLTHNDASSLDAKVWRCVKVVISLEKEELIEQQESSTNIAGDDSYRVGETSTEKLNSDELTNVSSVSTQSAIDSANYNAEKDYNDAQNSIDSVDDSSSSGYGKEYEFFNSLAKENPILRNKIVDKIKYFDPAYHSITPEGFNARLTFLQQCTKQGSTNSASDTVSTKTASNLAFGAPPICVLRIGDFYNTKIIIDSLNIDYEDISWDLNDEGIGVMPMIANINIGFKFLGGSDLSGPINRLQNAVSFNYYANTTVYDNRSELVEYDENGQIISFKKNQ